MFQHIGACGNPLVFQEFWNVRRTCLLAVSFLFFLHRHDDVTPSWFRALESHVLRVPNGNGIKKVVFTICVGLVCGCSTEAAFLFASLLCNDIGSGAQLSCAWKRSTRLGDCQA